MFVLSLKEKKLHELKTCKIPKIQQALKFPNKKKIPQM
jgi:hypothetical protein